MLSVTAFFVILQQGVIFLDMDHALTIKEQQKRNNEDNPIVISNSFGTIENGYTHDSYNNKLAAHKPYDFFTGNSRKYAETVSIKPLANEKIFTIRSKESSCSSSNSFMVKTKETIRTSKSNLAISSNSCEEPWVIQNIDLPTYRSLLLCVLEDQPPDYKEVTQTIPNNNEVRKILRKLELI